ncbi:hypothetical protein PNOK_0581100 [Pyrrhoderma noxium]|uniref:Uncharacterized protein n=1 Tax=Pyrrhoderma noxium TaxID=2282107 RepID=A0A286UHA2_9AGAM|nr:hypothetical protein PNOK_0581100 [Pyrrhoderma noxium]
MGISKTARAKVTRNARIKKDMLKLLPPPIVERDACICSHCSRVRFDQTVSDSVAITQATVEPEEGQYASRVLGDWEKVQRERLRESRKKVLRSDAMRDAMVHHLAEFIQDMNVLKRRGVEWSPDTVSEIGETSDSGSEGGGMTSDSDASNLGCQPSSSGIRSEGGQNNTPIVRNEGAEPSNQPQSAPALRLRINNKVIRLSPLRPRS